MNTNKITFPFMKRQRLTIKQLDDYLNNVSDDSDGSDGSDECKHHVHVYINEQWIFSILCGFDYKSSLKQNIKTNNTFSSYKDFEIAVLNKNGKIGARLEQPRKYFNSNWVNIFEPGNQPIAPHVNRKTIVEIINDIYYSCETQKNLL